MRQGERQADLHRDERGSILLVIPTLNEARHIGNCMRRMLAQMSQHDELAVVDGGSGDATIELARSIAPGDDRIHFLNNQRKIQSSALNHAVRELGGRHRYILRVDAHSSYSDRFIDRLCEAHRTTGAQSIVVPMRAVGKSAFEIGAATAQNSRLGNGGSLHRRPGISRFVDHGHHALFEADAFRRVGGYDETFTHNEDFEFDHRLTKEGGTIFLQHDALIDYHPRSSLAALARQYFNFGKGRARSVLKHGIVPKMRQIAPVLIVLCMIGSIVALPFSSFFVLFPLVYMVLICLWALRSSLAARRMAVLWCGPAVMAMHLAWGAGFLTQTLVHVMDRQPRSAG